MSVSERSCRAGAVRPRPRDDWIRVAADELDTMSAVSAQLFFFFQAEDGIRDYKVTGVQTCALPISFAHAAAGVMTVLTPLPVAACAKASVMRESGKRAVTSRLMPSVGMRASARRKAAPRPKAPRILTSRK